MTQPVREAALPLEPTATLTLSLSPSSVEALAEAIAARIAPPETNPWLSATQAAAYLRIPYRSLQERAAAGRLRHAQLDGRLRFRRSWLDDAVLEEAP